MKSHRILMETARTQVQHLGPVFGFLPWLDWPQGLSYTYILQSPTLALGIRASEEAARLPM